MSTATLPDLTDIPTISDDDLCHLVRDGASACGAPAQGSCTGTPWTGQDTCPDCKRRVCPECLAIGRREWGLG